ncbi:DUF1214 domain-containing protein [Sphingorhabdus pulchriflava]|uniref:DUF1214 domain-containing protein n=1 Tax=Sphingorhabdus pulchriflava TaxID=2292257 RepID=A0A371BFS2_9SPHN|nr:DUF1214 domain-containing protein [Sphingorhabdus pulchriflava]RDV06211.1 DUF1214 domain-containing protein [Sphingorhabdus pulchriflava]
MKPWLRYSICILLGLAGGTVYAVHQVRSADLGRQVTNGPWSTNTDNGTKDATALSRARVALFGLLALPAKEAMYFQARTDSDGAPLKGNCTYTVQGGEIDARWWSITLYRGEGWLVKNAANRWSVGGNAPVRDAGGNWSFTVSPKKADGVWLPTGRTPQFDLTLRTYHPKGALLNDPAKAKLPSINKETCA